MAPAQRIAAILSSALTSCVTATPHRQAVQPDMGKPIEIDERSGGYRQEGRVIQLSALEHGLALDPAASAKMAGYIAKSGLASLFAEGGILFTIGGVGYLAFPPTRGDRVFGWGSVAIGLSSLAVAVPLMVSTNRQLRSAVESHNAGLAAPLPANLLFSAQPHLTVLPDAHRGRKCVAGAAFSF